VTTYFVTRHIGAAAWAQQQEIEYDQIVEHLDPSTVEVGDTVIGSLPTNLAAEVCKRGAKYQHLSLKVPKELRGGELSAAQLIQLGAKLQPFFVEEL
jgi:CRISPR-associated protein Csx16